MTWETTIGAGGKAHHFDDAGKSACADRKGIWPGATLGDLFTRPRRATSAEDHICFFCAEKYPRRCDCWSCEMKRNGALRPGRMPR